MYIKLNILPKWEEELLGPAPCPSSMKPRFDVCLTGMCTCNTNIYIYICVCVCVCVHEFTLFPLDLDTIKPEDRRGWIPILYAHFLRVRINLYIATARHISLWCCCPDDRTEGESHQEKMKRPEREKSSSCLAALQTGLHVPLATYTLHLDQSGHGCKHDRSSYTKLIMGSGPYGSSRTFGVWSSAL